MNIVTRNRFLFALLPALLICFIPASGQKTIPLYSGSIPHAKSAPDAEYTNSGGAVLKVSKPTLTIYLPEKSNRKTPAVIVCPGGGYGSLMMTYEGNDVGRALAKKGIAAFVLKYRLPDEKIMQWQYAGPVQDAMQAIKLVRENAASYRVDPSKVGIMGFSAGGHLAASTGILDSSLVDPEKVNGFARPDFMILVYPVITMDTVRGHKGSTFNLLGNSPDSSMIEKFSLQNHVTSATPPAFLTVAANDDMLVSSLLLFEAMRAKKVSVELHVYSTGGHGFLKYPPYEEWSRLFINWMKQRGYLEK